MREFSCVTWDDGSPVPTLSFVFADSLDRARVHAQRLLRETPGGREVEICEGGRKVAVETRGSFAA